MNNRAINQHGYYVDSVFAPHQIQELRRRVEEAYNRQLGIPCRMEEYHNLGIDDEWHAKHWRNSARLINGRGIDPGFGGSIFERTAGVPEMTWRLVRPGRECDVGPMHADQWEWDINGMTVPEECRAIRVWTLLGGERSAHFAVVPGSHKQSPAWHKEARHGTFKSRMDQEIELTPIEMALGESIVFDHSLLHKGLAPQTNKCRVSIEFTYFLPRA